MAKKKAKKSTKAVSYSKGWGGFTPFQLIVIFSVFVVLAVYMMM